MLTSNILSDSDFAPDSLRNKLKMCGIRTASGYWNWCRSPACDRCRRYRARASADSISDWAIGEGNHRVQKVFISTRLCVDPDDLLSEISRIRRSLRRSLDRHQRESSRWCSVKIVGVFIPSWKDGRWSASLQGVVHLGRIHEVTFLDAIEPLMAVRLEAFPSCLLRQDIYDHVQRAVLSTHGLRACGAHELVSYFAAVNTRGGFKSLVYRRGFQTPA